MENTILIVDDNEMNREILKMLFSDKYTILEANNGKEALETLEICRDNVDVILLDLIMPVMDGFAVLETRAELEYARNIPVVVITSSGAMEDQIRAFKLGANDYVNKPFIPEIVLSRVDNVMASHQRLLSVELEAEKLKTKAALDQMTSLYNKTTSEKLIEEVLQSKPEELHALILIDIDNFKSINDTSGHLAGDHTIRIVADLISSHFRKTDIVGRVGGDEFIVLMQDVPSLELVRTKVNELVQIMKYKPNLTIPENVSLSIGFVTNDSKPFHYDELFVKADEALYIAKDSGKARYQEYGMEPINLSDDERPTALLLGRNRSVCSAVHALVPIELRIVEVLDLKELKRMKKSTLEECVVIYVDATDPDEELEEFWKEISKTEGIRMENVLAICPEGELRQYQQAMMAGVADILTAPIDKAAFKRRTLKHLEDIGITKMDNQ